MLIVFNFFWLYIMNEIIKDVYETNFGTAYEVYKEAVTKRITVLGCKMLKTI